MIRSFRIEMLAFSGAALTVVVVVAAACFGSSSAHNHFTLSEHISAGGHRQKFVVYLPSMVNDERLPLLVFLGGIEGVGNDGRQQLKNHLAFSLYRRVCEDRSVQCVAIFPQPNRPWSASRLDRELLCEIVDEICRTHTIDRSRILLVGTADGARGSVKLVAENSRRWTRAVLFSSGDLPLEGRLPKDFPVTLYPYPGSVSGQGILQDTKALQEEFGGSIECAGLLTDNLWEMPGFSNWLKIPQESIDRPAEVAQCCIKSGLP